jgi:hypothetical protein
MPMVVSPRTREITGLECSEVKVFLHILIKTTLWKNLALNIFT